MKIVVFIGIIAQVWAVGKYNGFNQYVKAWTCNMLR